MTLEIIILSIVLVGLAGIGLAIKYYNKKQLPSYSSTKLQQAEERNETSCGADKDEKCKNDQLIT